MFIVIVYMNQPGHQMYVPLMNENDWEMAEFDKIGDIIQLKANHTLGVFNWLAIDTSDGEYRLEEIV